MRFHQKIKKISGRTRKLGNQRENLSGIEKSQHFKSVDWCV